ncbi:hypothetical protein JTE90_000950 [Oedothorax gibbosus]|uniref:SAP domain-containing protein n=1 Tax=Oedothorax gibbosus TaxID=931172 RepID=A0AAV6U5Y0_9ARAC|nr:hypothetical protein JTE90_000950 [Oedothorax gibbosus]
MLDCEDGEKDRNSNCRHCQAGGESENSRYWDIQLDPDLLETIASIYPEWFKDVSEGRLTSPPHHHDHNDNKESLKVKLMLRRPLNQLVDQGILPSLKSPPAFHEQRQKLERAKMGDLLKHKLQKRPDRQELTQQHILEDPCSDSSVQEKQHKQQLKKRLSNAESLSGLLSQRPLDLMQSEELLAQAVRESGGLSFKSSPCGTPSPRSSISRGGGGMSTHLDDDSPGSDGAFSPSPPYDFSEHSQSSLPSLEAASDPSSSNLPNQGSPCSGVTSFSMSPPSSVSSPVFPSVVSPAAEHIAEYLVHIQQQHHHHHMHQHPHTATTNHIKGNSNNNNRKKTKPKTQPKARTIKFHEYRGPPNAPKTSAPSSSTSTVPESSSHSELWLQQQQLFLRLQQECSMQNHALPTTNSAPHSSSSTALQKTSGDQIGQPTPTPIPTPQLFDSPNSPQKLLSNFEDLKVTDLRAELKKKGLPVSGSKPQLIKRLRSHLPTTTLSNSDDVTPTLPTSSSPTPLADHLPEPELSADQIRGLLESMDESGAGETGESGSLSNEDIVQLQQIWIEKLQRDLERSRKQLQQCQIPAASANNPSTSVPSKTAAAAATDQSTAAAATTSSFSGSDAVENKVAQRQIIHQILQQKIQQQELQKAQQRQQDTINATTPSPSSQQNSTLTALLKSSPLNATTLDMDSLTSVTPKVDLDPKQVLSASAFTGDAKRELLSEEDFATIALQVESPLDSNTTGHDDFPGVIPIFVCHADAKVLSSPTNALSNRSSSLPSFSALLTKPPPVRSNTDPQFQISRPPPNYSEATRQLKVKQHHLTPDGNDGNPRQSKKHKSSVKSQAVDDVLEILINNGELSPSAAQDPITPVSINSDHHTNPIFATAREPFFAKTTTTQLSTASQQSLLTSSPNGTKSRQPQSFFAKNPTATKDEDDLAETLLSPISSSDGGKINNQNSIKEVHHLPFLFAKTTATTKDHEELTQSLLAPISSKDNHKSMKGSTQNTDIHHLPFSLTSGKELDLQLAQSLMDLTPPSSTGFADPGCAPSSGGSLDFDFPLDMTDIDAMELDGLDHQTSSLDPNLSGVKPLDFGISGSKPADLAGHLMKLTDMGDIQDRLNDRGIDNDIIEFLGDFEDASGNSSSANFANSSSFGLGHDSDPLFASNGMDFFAGDDLDFKPHHELGFLPWGENAT